MATRDENSGDSRDRARLTTACVVATAHALLLAYTAVVLAGFAGELADRNQRVAVQAGLLAMAGALAIGMPMLAWLVMRRHARARTVLRGVEIVLAVAFPLLAPIPLMVMVLLRRNPTTSQREPSALAHPVVHIQGGEAEAKTMDRLGKRGPRLDHLLLAAGVAVLVLAGLCWATAHTPLGDKLGGDVGNSLGGTAAIVALAGMVVLIAGGLRVAYRMLWPNRSTSPDGLLVTALAMTVVAALCVAAGLSPLGDQANGEAAFGWRIGAVLFGGVGAVLLLVDAMRVGWRAARHRKRGGRGLRST